MAVNNQTIFGTIFGKASIQTSRLAVVKGKTKGLKETPSLWLLDRHGCSLSVTGGATAKVGTPTVKGLITVDSDTTNCQTNNKYTIDAGNNAHIDVYPTGTGPARGRSSCSP